MDPVIRNTDTNNEPPTSSDLTNVAEHITVENMAEQLDRHPMHNARK